MLEIMKAEIEDSNRLAECARNAYSKEIIEFCDSNKENLYPTTEEVEHDIKHYTYYKFLLDKKIIGGVYISQKDTTTASIEDFCIEPKYQNKGYGKFFISELEQLNKTIEKWILTTPLYSVRNQHLYEKQGYKRVKIDDYDGVISVYYQKLIRL